VDCRLNFRLIGGYQSLIMPFCHIAQHCINDDRLSQWAMAKFDSSYIWDPFADW